MVYAQLITNFGNFVFGFFIVSVQQGLEIHGFWFQKKTVQLKTVLREVYTYVLNEIFFTKTVYLQGFCSKSAYPKCFIKYFSFFVAVKLAKKVRAIICYQIIALIFFANFTATKDEKYFRTNSNPCILGACVLLKSCISNAAKQI